MRNAPVLLVLATLTQPVLVVLVFGNILPRLGPRRRRRSGTVMVPGLMAITMLMAGVQGVLMPLVTDLSGTREVDERLLAPISVLRRGARDASWPARCTPRPRASSRGPAMMLLMHGVAGVSVHADAGGCCCRWSSLCGLLSAAFGLNLGTQRAAALRGPAVRGRARAR